MKKAIKTLSIGVLVTFATTLAFTTSCNRVVTYEDGMFDYNEIYEDATNDTFQTNSEIENDDTERY